MFGEEKRAEIEKCQTFNKLKLLCLFNFSRQQIYSLLATKAVDIYLYILYILALEGKER
jgi:hypothetical protein